GAPGPAGLVGGRPEHGPGRHCLPGLRAPYASRVTIAASPPPIAWYGGSFVYYDEPEPVPTREELDAAAALARERRRAGCTPEDFGPEPGSRTHTGVVLGRFLPVHEGHRYLVEFARAHAEHVHIFARVAPDDPIPWEVRREWMLELFPGLP